MYIRENVLENEIRELKDKLNLTERDSDHLVDLENELVNLRECYIKGSIIRSKIKWINEGEKCSNFFCSLEKKNNSYVQLGHISLLKK